MKILELPEYEQDYEIDTVHYDSDLESFLVDVNPSVIFVNGVGVNAYSGKSPLCPKFDWFSKFYINRSAMYNVINEVKLKKTAEEVALMRNSAEIGCNAHVFVLKNTKPGMTECHVQTLFRVRKCDFKLLTSSSNRDSTTMLHLAHMSRFAQLERTEQCFTTTPTMDRSRMDRCF